MAGTTFKWNLPATAYPRPGDPQNLDWTGAVVAGVVQVTRDSNLGCEATHQLDQGTQHWEYNAPWNCKDIADWTIVCGGEDLFSASTTMTLGRGDVVELYYDLPDPQVGQINYYIKLNDKPARVLGLAAYGNVSNTNPSPAE